MAQSHGGDMVLLKSFCDVCELRSGPIPEAEAVMLRWNLPDDALRMSERPYWFVSGVAFARALYQPRGF